MDALISYSQSQRQQHLMGSITSPEQPMLDSTSSVSPINSLIQQQMYYQAHVPPGTSSASTSSAAYSQHFLNQYNMQHHQQQQQQQQRADFFKLFSSPNPGSSIPSSASSVCSTGSTGSNHSMSSPFLSSSQQSILNPARFGSSTQLAAGRPFLSAEDASYYNPAALLGHLQSKKSFPRIIQHFPMQYLINKGPYLIDHNHMWIT